MRISSFDELNRDQLKAVGEMFGTDIKSHMNKPTMIKELTETGVTPQLYNDMLAEAEEAEDLEQPEDKEQQQELSEDDEDVVVLKMTRKNASYEVRGYKFTRSHPFAVVRSDDADYLVEKGGGFRPASNKEIAEFYGRR